MVCASFNKQDFGHITYVTPELEVWTGFDKKTIIGANIDTMIPKSLASVHTDMMKRYFRTAEGRFGFNERVLFPTDANGFVAPSSGLLRVMPSLDRGLEMVILMKPNSDDVYMKTGIAIVDQDGVLIGINRATWEKFKIPPAACFGNSLGESPLMLNNIFPELPEGTIEQLVENEELRTQMHPYLMGRRFRANNDFENQENEPKQGEGQSPDKSMEKDSELSMEDKAIEVRLKSLGTNSFYGGALVWKIYSIVEDEANKELVQPTTSLPNLKPPESYVTQVVKMSSILDNNDKTPVGRGSGVDVVRGGQPSGALAGKKEAKERTAKKKKLKGVRSNDLSRTLRGEGGEASLGHEDSAEEQLGQELSPEQRQLRQLHKLAKRYSDKEAKSVRRLLGQRQVPTLIWAAVAFGLGPLVLFIVTSITGLWQASTWCQNAKDFLSAVSSVAEYSAFVSYAAGVMKLNQLIASGLISAPSSTFPWSSLASSLQTLAASGLSPSHQSLLSLKSTSAASGLATTLGSNLLSSPVTTFALGPNTLELISSPSLGISLDQYSTAVLKATTKAGDTSAYFIVRNGAAALRETLEQALIGFQGQVQENTDVWGLIQDCLLVVIQFVAIVYTWKRLKIVTVLQSRVLDVLKTIKTERIQEMLENIRIFKEQAADAKTAIVEDKLALTEGENSVEDETKRKDINFSKEASMTHKLDQIDNPEKVVAPVGPPPVESPAQEDQTTSVAPPAQSTNSLGTLILLLSATLALSLLLLARRLVSSSRTSNSSNLYTTQIRLLTVRPTVTSMPILLLSQLPPFSSTTPPPALTASKLYSDSSWLESLEQPSVSISDFNSFLLAFNGQQCGSSLAAGTLGCSFSFPFQATRFPTVLARLSSVYSSVREVIIANGDLKTKAGAYRDQGVDEYVLRSQGLLRVIEAQMSSAVTSRLEYWRDLAVLFESLILVFSVLLGALACYLIVNTYSKRIWQSKSMLNLVPASIVQDTLQILDLLFMGDFMKITQ